MPRSMAPSAVRAIGDSSFAFVPAEGMRRPQEKRPRSCSLNSYPVDYALVARNPTCCLSLLLPGLRVIEGPMEKANLEKAERGEPGGRFDPRAAASPRSRARPSGWADDRRVWQMSST